MHRNAKDRIPVGTSLASTKLAGLSAPSAAVAVCAIMGDKSTFARNAKGRRCVSICVREVSAKNA